MAGLKTTVDRMFVDQFRPDNLRQFVLPGAATGIGVATAAGGAKTYGAWVDLALLAAITQDTLIVGVVLDTPSALEVYTIDIGSCIGYANAAALNAVPAAIIAAHRAEVRAGVITAAGLVGTLYLSTPVFIPAGVGILARMYNVVGAATINVSAICLQNF